MRRIHQPLTLLVFSAFLASSASAQTQLAARIGHNDPSKYKLHVKATVIQTVGRKGYDGIAIALVVDQ